jgi:hypothetical protein
MKDNFRSNQT